MPRQTLSCPTLNLKKRLKLKTWQEDRREMNAHIDKVENQLRAELNKAVNDLTHCQEVRGCVSLCLCVCVLAETILLVPHRVRLSVLFPCVCVCVCMRAGLNDLAHVPEVGAFSIPKLPPPSSPRLFLRVSWAMLRPQRLRGCLRLRACGHSCVRACVKRLFHK